MIVRLNYTMQKGAIGPYILQINPDEIKDVLYEDIKEDDNPMYLMIINDIHHDEYQIKFVDSVSRDTAFEDLWIAINTPPIRENQFYKKGEATWH
jgi:hypothetical protein